ncbi:MAG: hypothetical protein P8X51_05715 [Maritimibacter sp.]
MNQDLITLGWRQSFTGQMTSEEVETLTPMRIAEVRRRSLILLADDLTRHEVALTGDHVILCSPMASGLSGGWSAAR